MARKKKTTEQPVVAAEPAIAAQNEVLKTIKNELAPAVKEEQKPKADTIPMLFIQHKKSKFATLIPEAEFMAHDEDYRDGWNIVDRAPKAKD